MAELSTDVPFICFEYLSTDEVLIADANGRLTLAKGIRSQETISISIFRTKIPRFKQVKAVPQTENIVTISTDGTIAFWDLQKMRSSEDGMLVNLKPVNKVKSVHRLLCLAVNVIEPETGNL